MERRGPTTPYIKLDISYSYAKWENTSMYVKHPVEKITLKRCPVENIMKHSGLSVI